MNQNTGKGQVNRYHESCKRGFQDYYRICPSKLSKRELEDLYYNVLEKNVELKKNLTLQQDKSKMLSVQVQRLNAYKGGVGKDLVSKAIVEEQKESIEQLKRANERMAERIHVLNLRLCSAKQFQGKTKGNMFLSKNTSSKSLNCKHISNIKGSNAATSCCEVISPNRDINTAETQTEMDNDKDCETKCKEQMAMLNEKIVNLQQELEGSQKDYEQRIVKLEKLVTQHRDENMRIRSEHAAGAGARAARLDQLRTRLRAADADNNELNTNLSIEKNKVAELETELKLVDISTHAAKTIELLEQKMTKARNNLKNAAEKVKPSKEDVTVTKEESKSLKDDSGYTETQDLSKSIQTEEDKEKENLNEELLRKISLLQSEFNKLKKTSAASEISTANESVEREFNFVHDNSGGLHANELANYGYDHKQVKNNAIRLSEGLDEKYKVYGNKFANANSVGTSGENTAKYDTCENKYSDNKRVTDGMPAIGSTYTEKAKVNASKHTSVEKPDKNDAYVDNESNASSKPLFDKIPLKYNITISYDSKSVDVSSKGTTSSSKKPYEHASDTDSKRTTEDNALLGEPGGYDMAGTAKSGIKDPSSTNKINKDSIKNHDSFDSGQNRIGYYNNGPNKSTTNNQYPKETTDESCSQSISQETSSCSCVTKDENVEKSANKNNEFGESRKSSIGGKTENIKNSLATSQSIAFPHQFQENNLTNNKVDISCGNKYNNNDNRELFVESKDSLDDIIDSKNQQELQDNYRETVDGYNTLKTQTPLSNKTAKIINDYARSDECEPCKPRVSLAVNDNTNNKQTDMRLPQKSSRIQSSSFATSMKHTGNQTQKQEITKSGNEQPITGQKTTVENKVDAYLNSNWPSKNQVKKPDTATQVDVDERSFVLQSPKNSPRDMSSGKTYSVPDKLSRAASPDNTEHEISSMTDWPLEREDHKTQYNTPPSPGEKASSGRHDQCSSLSEGECYGLSVGERDPVLCNKPSIQNPVNTQETMEATLQSISDELARCRQLLLSQRTEEVILWSSVK